MNLLKIIIPLILLFSCSINTFANIYKVGATRTYVSPNALYVADILEDSDTIEIDADAYIGTASLAVWKKNNLFIRSVGGRPVLDADGQYIWGKGIWVLAGNNITVQGFEFYGAKVPDRNGAGIRLDGIGMHVRNCLFHGNETGILTNNTYAGEVIIEHSEFANNGYGDGYSHNVYIGHVEKLIFQFNYTYHAKIGHNLKTRAAQNYILYNRIMDEETGNSSRLLDIPNGGFSIVMGNLFMQGNNAPNNNLIGYGLEGLSNNANNELFLINNTLVNKRINSCLFLHIKDGASVVKVANNIFAGTGDLYHGPITELTNNLVRQSISDIKFIDEPNYNYQLAPNSPAIDAGTNIAAINDHSLVPQFVYTHPIDGSERVIDGQIDIGAYEHRHVVAMETELAATPITIYPNPASNILQISLKPEKIKELSIIDIYGKTVLKTLNLNSLDVSQLPHGNYFLNIELHNKEFIIKKFVK